tara:strand:- start:2910 stop:3203 length:294 start_codon:yes stop_codon:yes gene_type:complete
MAKKISFNWNCPHCDHRHKDTYPFHFDMSQTYSGDRECGHCGKEVKLWWGFSVEGWPQKDPKSFELKRIKKKRRKRGRDKVDKEDDGTKKDRGYCNK